VYNDLRRFIAGLDEKGQLVRIHERLSPKFEIPGMVKYFTQKRNLGLFFENVEGYSLPIVANLVGTKERLAIAFGVPEADLPSAYRSRMERRIKPVVVSDAPVKQVEIVSDVDVLSTIPVLTHHARDASPYFTSAITIARDPDTGIRGMGIHRIQVRAGNTVAIFLATPPLSHFLARSEAKGRPLDIAIIIGIDPITFFASVEWAPSGTDKLEIAGGLRSEPVEVVKCGTVDLEVPAHAEFVLEGKIIPGEREPEGPFGESTGCYFSNRSPVAKITAITHRRDAIYQALVPFSGEDGVLLDVGWEMRHLPELQKVYPFVRMVHFTNTLLIATVQIRKSSDVDARKIIEELWSNPFVKIVIVLDDDVDPYDPEEVNWAIATRVQPGRDIVIKGGMAGLSIDPSAGRQEVTGEFAILANETSKIGIDATKPMDDFERYERTDVPEEVKNKIGPIIASYLGRSQKTAI
jgi:2,5-furandicarboxylate decarboxylase 1